MRTIFPIAFKLYMIIALIKKKKPIVLGQGHSDLKCGKSFCITHLIYTLLSS